LAIAPVAVFGAFSVPAGGGRLQPRLSGRRWTVRLALGAIVSPLAYLGTGRFRAAAWTVAPDACARLPMGLAALRLCGGIELGVVWARGRGYAEPRKTIAPHVAPTFDLEVAAPIADRVALVAGAGLAVALLRTRFVAGDLVASGWPVSVRALAGISVDLARKPGSRGRKTDR
jgi:hypothetical protein